MATINADMLVEALRRRVAELTRHNQLEHDSIRSGLTRVQIDVLEDIIDAVEEAAE